MQRKYYGDNSPEVKENYYRFIRLSGPVKEIHNDGEKQGLEVRVAEELYEFGTQITTYPSEITKTITTTTRIISDDTNYVEIPDSIEKNKENQK